MTRKFFHTLAISLLLASPAMARQSYFDMTETPNSNLSPFVKWTSTLRRLSGQERQAKPPCGNRSYPCMADDWASLREQLQGADLDEQLDTVNRWANKHPYILDQVNWGMDDYWVTPFEFMGVNGDCEDYAISKYYMLRQLGISPSRMRIIILQDLNLGGIIHAVLGVYDDDNDLQLLDNQSPRVTEAMRVYHYRPIYGVNETGWWAYHPRTQ